MPGGKEDRLENTEKVDLISYKKGIDQGSGKYAEVQLNFHAVSKKERDQIDELIEEFLDSVSTILN